MSWLLLTLIFSLAHTCQQDPPPFEGTEIWATRDVKWEKAPAEINPNLSAGRATILYFRSDGRFGLMYCLLLRVPKSIAVSRGDGQVIYEGSWVQDRNTVRVRYRLVYRTVRIVGEKLPGPEITDVLQMRSGTRGQSNGEITMDGRVFVPYDDKLNGPIIEKEYFHFPDLKTAPKK